MNSASVDIQSALSVASCFGTKVKAEVIKGLSRTGGSFADLQISIDRAVQEGFIDFDGTYYRFAHDKVRESACEIIQKDRHQLHFQIGLALFSSCANQNEDTEMLFNTVEQINYGVPSSLNCESQRISIARLNYRAGVASLKGWNYVGALTYLKVARSLLGLWSEHYELNLDVHYQLAKAAYSCGDIDTTKNALDEVIRDLCIFLMYEYHHAFIRIFFTLAPIFRFLPKEKALMTNSTHTVFSLFSSNIAKKLQTLTLR